MRSTVPTMVRILNDKMFWSVFNDFPGHLMYMFRGMHKPKFCKLLICVDFLFFSELFGDKSTPICLHSLGLWLDGLEEV